MIFIRINKKRPDFLKAWTGYRTQWWFDLRNITVGVWRWSLTVGWKANE